MIQSPFIKWDTVTIHKTDTLIHGDTLTITLTLQPGPDEGQNTLVTGDIYANSNINSNPDIKYRHLELRCTGWWNWHGTNLS